MEFIDYFDRVEIISLLERKDRRQDLARQISKLGKSIDGDRIRFFDAIKPINKGAFPSIGARGCFESHLEVLRNASLDGIKNLLIIEDDINFSDDINNISSFFYDLLNDSDWGFLYLGHVINGIDKQQGNPQMLPVNHDTGVRCTHLIAISGTTIPKLVEYLEAMYSRDAGDPAGGPMHVDGAYSWFRRETQCKTFVATPPIGYQRASRSDITDGRLYDKLPFVKDIVNYIRKFK